MQRYNKAYAGGIGAALAALVIAGLNYAGMTVSGELQSAIYVVFSALGPLLGPANK